MKRFRVPLILLLITAGGAYLRFTGLDWGLPWRYHCDENTFINAANAMRHAPRLNYLNPKWFYHPTLSIYLLCLLAKVYSLFAPLTLARVHLLGRMNSAFWGTLSLPLLYLLGKRLYGRGAGIIAALFLAVTPIHVQVSHFFTPDIMLGFFLILTMYFSAGVMRDGRRASYLYAGAAAGAGMAAKYWAPALFPLLLAYLFRLPRNPIRREDTRKFLFALLLAGLTFFLLSPYVILDAGEAVPRILLWSRKTTGAIPQIWSLHFTGTHRYLFQLTRNLPWALGLPLSLLAGTGFVFIAFRRRREDIMVASWILLNFLLIGSWYIKSIRYLLPLIPFFCLAAAVLPVRMTTRRGGRLPAVILGGTAFLWSALFSSALLHVYTTPHAKTRAARWINRNIPPGTRIATDHSLPLGKRNGLPERCRENLLDFTALFSGSLPPEEKAAYLRRRTAGAEYIILPDELFAYFQEAGDRYPAEDRFLKDLISGRGDFYLYRTFKVYPRLGRWEWKDDGAELSFHFFDHPGVYVFKRKGNQAQAEFSSLPNAGNPE
jgi:4-amino-4-deoxy-L-arabinose transferase-like glycosyltransferase